MAPSPNIDDPESINKFLAIIRGSSAPPQTSPLPAVTSDSPTESAEPTLPDIARSPERGTRAPPPTPASKASVQHNGNHLGLVPEVNDLGPETPSQASPHNGGVHLEPVPEAHLVEPVSVEDDTAALVTLANKSTENLTHSKHAPMRRFPLVNKHPSSERHAPTMPAHVVKKVSSADRPANDPMERPANTELLEKMKALSCGSSFQDFIVAEFRKEHSHEDKQPTNNIKKDSHEEEEPNTNMVKIEGAVSDVEDTADTSKNLVDDRLPSPKCDATVLFPAFEGTAIATSAKEESVRKEPVNQEEEDREHMTYFSSWGSAAPRDSPKSRVRTVVLTKLPATADATLVVSLIHGSAIETLKLVKPSEDITTTARVTFTAGDAAVAYYDKYPNGIDFRFQGRKYMALVDMGKDVDVVSGRMRGYLESGASRIVRATGAEDDWGIRALNKPAEGKGRKVEAIVDTYRGEVRTVIFRFTNIADAVQFKGQLVRDIDWECCNIQFMDDPCEKATGVHMEKY